MRFSICTLGCKSNQYESQAMAKLLESRGHSQVTGQGPVDAVLINTCSVTAVSDKKSRQTIRGVRKDHPQALIGVCGCYAQLEPEEMGKLEVNLIGGTGNHLAFIQELEELHHQTNPEVAQLPYDDPRLRLGIEALPSGGLEGRTRALLKIQDGCENYCSYCIIPYARGKCRSLSPVDFSLALGELMDQGYREIVLTGIEISSWGIDLPGEQRLMDLLELADQQVLGQQEEGGKRVYFRLGSLEPRTITEAFCARAQKLSFLQPQFHLSLQSGCDRVLCLMNRKYDTARFYESVTLLRKHFSRPALTTDLIVGFPGETEEDFAQTLDFLQRCQFAQMHIFPYSPREGTPAAKLPQISGDVKKNRAQRATALAQEMEEAYRGQFVGEKIPVLFEQQDKEGNWQGLCPRHISVTVSSETPLQNTIQTVQIISSKGTGLWGNL